MEAPPKINPSPSLNIFAGVVLGASLLGVCAVVFFFNPVQSGFYPVCLFHRLTGWNCPGCGATRALYALLHGDFGAAFRDNALFVLTLLLAGGRGGWIWASKTMGRPVGNFVPPKFLWIYLALLLLFGVVRNLPGFEWLSPAPTA
jgi:hypothetical protein